MAMVAPTRAIIMRISTRPNLASWLSLTGATLVRINPALPTPGLRTAFFTGSCQHESRQDGLNPRVQPKWELTAELRGLHFGWLMGFPFSFKCTQRAKAGESVPFQKGGERPNPVGRGARLIEEATHGTA